jgi:hypothetical protein
MKKEASPITNKERKTSEEIKTAIVNELTKGPKSTSEIAQLINSNWITTEKFILELLQEKRVTELISASKSKVYASTTDPAFFYLPLSQETRNKTLALLSLINERWKEKTNKTPLKTVLQKLAVEFVEDQKDLSKDIPIMRFHYGQTLALRYEENSKSDNLKLTKEQEKKLADLIDEYQDYSSKDAKDKQYKKDFMKFYNEKEKLWNYMAQKSNELAEESLLNMGIYYYPDLVESFGLFDRFVYCAVNVFNLKENQEEILSRLKELYSLVWDCLTTESYFNDIQNSIEESKKELFNQIKSNHLLSKINNVREVLNELESEINSLVMGESSSDKVSDFVRELVND